MGLSGCTVARPGSAGPGALERRAGESGSLLAGREARRRALRVRGKPMVGWLRGLLLAMMGAAGGGGQRSQGGTSAR